MKDYTPLELVAFLIFAIALVYFIAGFVFGLHV